MLSDQPHPHVHEPRVHQPYRPQPRFGRRPLTWILAIALSVPGAAWGQEPDNAAEEVRRTRIAQNAAIAARDFAEAASYWVEDVVVTAGLGVVLAGADSYRRAFEAQGRLTYERTPDEIAVSAHWPLAFETGHWEGRDESGAVLISGQYSAQWVEDSGRWLIRSELFVASACTGVACGWPVGSRPGGSGDL